ncbi:hypothetical protein GGI22_005512 [Coemansia erecta]|nr:hypothetical protein GGI22_005512 [Coemansia erecta]
MIVDSTPLTLANVPAKFDKLLYVGISKQHKDVCKTRDLRQALDMLGAGWRDPWNQFDEMPSTATDNILTTYRNKCVGLQSGLFSRRVAEPIYQSAFGALAEAVQEHVSV